MKIEVLKDIKKAEEEYKKTINEAEERRKATISGAELEADNLIQNAQNDAEEYKKKRIADARIEAGSRYEKIVHAGKTEANALESKGKQNLAKAVDLLVTRFKEQLNVSS